MDKIKFAEFTPITPSFDSKKDTVMKYYSSNGLDPNNEYLKRFLDYENTQQLTTLESAVQPTPKISVDKLLGSIDFSSGKVNPNEGTNPEPTVPLRETSAPKTKKEFIERYKDLAIAASKKTGISSDLMLAQIALETGWGKSTPGFNIGGIKANKSWKGDTQTLLTTEYNKKKGYYKSNEAFRKYSSPEEGFWGYVDFLNTNKRYNSVKGVDDPYLAAQIMGTTGYATDKDYVPKLHNVLDSIRKLK